MSITESELLAMPESDYMNAAQVTYFKSLLLQELAQLRENLSHTSEHLREVEDAADPADRATQEESRGLELRTRDRERKYLKAVNSALARIEDGQLWLLCRYWRADWSIKTDCTPYYQALFRGARAT